MGSMTEAANTPETETIAVEGMVSLPASAPASVERTREGYDMTAAALEKVQQHLDISRQLGKDLTQLAQEVHCEKIGAKYQLAQLSRYLAHSKTWNGKWGAPNRSQTPVSKALSTNFWLLRRRRKRL
jgi:hypothetical protein